MKDGNDVGMVAAESRRRRHTDRRRSVYVLCVGELSDVKEFIQVDSDQTFHPDRIMHSIQVPLLKYFVMTVDSMDMFHNENDNNIS
jgi:hypothetical protein